MKKKKVIKLINLLFIIICFLGVIFSLKNVLSWKISNKENEETFKKIDEIINESIITNEENETVYDIDFESLKKQNSDVVGYLKVNNTKIDYVVVKGKDNDYYLNHDFNKKKNKAGWIFTDYRNKVNGEDRNLVIYGHETHDGTMFGSLSNLLKEENLNDQTIITFITDSSEKQYQIFSIYTIEPEDYYIKTEFSVEEFEKFKEKLKERSKYKININLKNKNILTLSTCQKYGAKRLAVHAVEI